MITFLQLGVFTQTGMMMKSILPIVLIQAKTSPIQNLIQLFQCEGVTNI